MVALSPRLRFLLATCFFTIVNANIRFEDIDDLTALTKDAISKFPAQPVAGHDQAQELLVVSDQAPLSSDTELDKKAKHERKDIEPILNAFSELGSTLSIRLRKPSNRAPWWYPVSTCDSTIITSYHDHMNQTTHFLALLMELKPIPTISSLFVSNQGEKLFLQIERMQTLWASRNEVSGRSPPVAMLAEHLERVLKNTQGLPSPIPDLQRGSFIEQRQELYKRSGCFPFPGPDQILRRDVEIVELLNDLIDQYWSEYSTPRR